MQKLIALICSVAATASLYAMPGPTASEPPTRLSILYLFVDLSDVAQPDIHRAMKDLSQYFRARVNGGSKTTTRANPVVLDKSFWAKIDPLNPDSKSPDARMAGTLSAYNFASIAKAVVAQYEVVGKIDIENYEAVVLIHDLFDGAYPYEMKQALQVVFPGNVRRTVFPLNYRKLGIQD